MDFAPYQSESPDTSRRSLHIQQQNSKRPFSPPLFGGVGSAGGRAGKSSPNNVNIRPYSPPIIPKSTGSPVPVLPVHSGHVGRGGGGGGGSSSLGGSNWGSRFTAGFGSARESVEQFETSLPLRLDYEAMVSYLLLPPAGGVLLLILEHKSDYVRFHAWQSSLLFSFLAVIHFVFSFSTFLSYTLLLFDLGLIGYLSYAAYRDADTLDRCEVPFFGSLASNILSDE